jgi:hypothetical protein
LRGKRTGRAGSPHPQTKRLRRGVGWRECARTHAHVCVSARALTRACDADGDSSLWQPGKSWCGRGHGMSVRASSHARALACACVRVTSQQCRLRAAAGAWRGRWSPTCRTCAGLTAPDRPARTGTGARCSARANLPTARPSCSDVRAACAPCPAHRARCPPRASGAGPAAGSACILHAYRTLARSGHARQSTQTSGGCPVPESRTM